MDVSQLEPAERDPRKLRKTALILVVLMIIGAILILWAYQAFGKRTSESDRPSIESKITDDCRMVTADGEVRDIQDLKGKVTLALILAQDSAEKSAASLSALREVMKSFEGKDEKPTVLVFVLDGSEEKPEEMSNILADFGKEPEVWRVATGADGKVSVRAFSKNRMRFGSYPQKKDGKWDYDTKLVLLDQFLHVRGIPGSNEGWNFGLVAEMESKFEQARKDHPDEELKPLPMTTVRLRELLINSINYLYAHPDEKGQK